MRRVISFFSLICVICGCNSAVKDELTGIFYSANKLYEQGKYEEAINEYKKGIDMGYQSGPLYYNIGNCYFKLGALGKTILYYEKAKRLIPNDPELKFNYNYVQSLLKDKISIPRKNWFLKRGIQIAELLTFNEWLIFVISVWFVFIALLIINIFIPHYKIIFRYLIIALIIILLTGIFCSLNQYRTYRAPSAIIIPKEVTVRYGPGEGEVEAFLLHEGTKVSLIKEKGNWYQIRLPDGKTGWLTKETVEKI